MANRAGDAKVTDTEFEEGQRDEQCAKALARAVLAQACTASSGVDE
ncbi:MAG: hypothetical protein LBI28_06470 [Treponema sp.]|nr:hypothetical protein [Treponema sp.]